MRVKQVAFTTLGTLEVMNKPRGSSDTACPMSFPFLIDKSAESAWRSRSSLLRQRQIDNRVLGDLRGGAVRIFVFEPVTYILSDVMFAIRVHSI
jgi:hypothetical protein